MPVQFKVNKDSLAREIVPEGRYILEVVGFDPKPASKAGSGDNLNGRFQVIDRVGESDPELRNKRAIVFDSLNTSFGIGIQDFVLSCGLMLEDDGSMPGSFEQKGAKYVYSGPLMGKRFEADLVIDTYNGNMSNKVMTYWNAIPDLATTHPKIRFNNKLVKK